MPLKTAHPPLTRREIYELVRRRYGAPRAEHLLVDRIHRHVDAQLKASVATTTTANNGRRAKPRRQ